MALTSETAQKDTHKNPILMPLGTRKKCNNCILLIKKFLGLCCFEKFKKLANELRLSLKFKFLFCLD